jgi:hypothetical protein
VLGFALGGGDLGEIQTALRPSDFSLERNRRIFTRIMDLHERGERVEYVMVAEELKKHGELESDGLSYLLGLTEGLPDLPNLSGHIKSLKDKSLLRHLAIETKALSEKCYEPGQGPAHILSAIERLCREHDTEPKCRQYLGIPQWPEPMREEAMHGLAGELVRALQPHTEADPAALLMQTIAGFGSLIGRGPYYLAEADRHYTNIFLNIVGLTSKARKGTSWGRVRSALCNVDQHWADNCLLGGLGSGEALIEAVGKDGADKRCLILESELARLLAVISREGCTLSANLRDGFDSGSLSVTTRRDKVRVTGAHMSLIGHITREELLRRLDNTELANGLCNRMLWVCARRSNILPHGGGSPDLQDIAIEFQQATAFARKTGETRIEMDAGARTRWEEVYPRLSEGQPGLLGAVTSRGEALVVRLALIYAVLDQSPKISTQHLLAALAAWEYCYASCAFIWGNTIGDPTADQILSALRRGEEGLTRREISNLFSRNKRAAELDRALGVLQSNGRIRSAMEDTGGRPITRYFVLQ